MTELETFSRQMDAPRPPVMKVVVTGLAVLILFFGALGTWGALAPLESAAIANGAVSVDKNRKTIQHYEGGIIKAIKVVEGQVVKEGQVLIELDQTKPRANIDLLRAKIRAADAQIKIITEEIVDLESLLRKGLVAKPRVLELQRRKAQLEGERGQHREELKAAQDVIRRSIIRSPLSGTIVALKVHTLGGVIKPGDPLMEIVPSKVPLFVEARVDPNDIDVVRRGLRAQVRLTPYSARHVLPLDGKVAWVSADGLKDEQTGTKYYLARIELDKKSSNLPDGISLYPGMPAEVMILTGKRTIFDYIAEPIYTSFRRSFREN